MTIRNLVIQNKVEIYLQDANTITLQQQDQNDNKMKFKLKKWETESH
jgi:hypothetical protein